MAEKWVHALFRVFIAGLVIAIFFIDKNINTRFPNTVRWNHAGYFLIAAGVLCVAGSLMRTKKDIEERKFQIWTAAIAAATALLQCMISIWMPINISADFQMVREMAVNLASGGTLADHPYFAVSPNNINITLILALCCKIFHSWRAVIFIGALFVNLSVTLMAVSVKKVTKHRLCGISVQVVGEVLAALTWRAFLPYTDNYAMVFAALMIFVYVSEKKAMQKIAWIIVSGLAGTFIKQTVFLILLAIGLHSIIVLLQTPRCRKQVSNAQRGNSGRNLVTVNAESVNRNKQAAVRAGIALFLFVAVFMAFQGIQNHTRRSLRYEASKAAKNWTYLFMVGQNQEYYGVVNGEDSALREQILKQYPQDGWNRAFVKEALHRIKSRGLLGNICFYLMKLDVAYNDGYFHNMREFDRGGVKHNLCYALYVDEETPWYALGAGLMQVSWDIVLALLMWNTLFSNRYASAESDTENETKNETVNNTMKKTNQETFCEIMILGITLYLMLFEGRAKYIYMFLPVYLFYAGVILDRFLGFYQKRLK